MSARQYKVTDGQPGADTRSDIRKLLDMVLTDDGRPFELRIANARLALPELPLRVDFMMEHHMSAFAGCKAGKMRAGGMFDGFVQRIRDELLCGEGFHKASRRHLAKYTFVGALRLVVPSTSRDFDDVDAAWKALNPSVYAVADSE